MVTSISFKDRLRMFEPQNEMTAAPEPPPETMPSEEDEEEADFDFTPESEAEPAMEPTIQVEAEAEVEPAAEIPEPEKVEEEKTAPPEPGIEPEPEAEPAIQVEAEAEVEPAPEAERAEVEFEVPPEAEPGIQLEAEAEAETAEPGLPEEIKKDRIVDRGVPEPPAGEEQGPLIPEEQLVKPGEPSDGEPLLEELSREQLKEFEEGEAGAGDAEWTRYADKKTGPELPKSKIDMNELPKDAVGLKETLTDLRQAEAYNIQGEDNVSKNLHNNAIKDFTRALEINPNYVDALINRGSAYSQLGRFNDALIDFNHALKFEKKDSELYNKRGEIYLQNNMFDQAIKDFTAAIVLNPMFSDAYLNRGRAYSEKGMPDEAMNDFNHAIKADSDHAFGFIDRAAPGLSIGEDQPDSKIEADDYIKKGLADLENEKYKEAADNFTHAINLFATEPDGYINRGRALIKLNKPDEAMADFDPLNASLYYWRAQAWKEKGDDFNMKEDLKLSCEMGYEPACLEYKKLKPADKG